MNEDSMLIPTISELFMAPGCRKFQSMPDLLVRTVTDQKALVDVLIVTMTHLTLLIAKL
jgi:hypothetical protein